MTVQRNTVGAPIPGTVPFDNTRAFFLSRASEIAKEEPERDIQGDERENLVTELVNLLGNSFRPCLIPHPFPRVHGRIHIAESRKELEKTLIFFYISVEMGSITEILSVLVCCLLFVVCSLKFVVCSHTVRQTLHACTPAERGNSVAETQPINQYFLLHSLQSGMDTPHHTER